MYQPQIDRDGGPLYLAIADAIATDISAGTLAPDDRLPPHRDLAYRLGVTVGTVSRAYAEITRRGLAQGEVGRGTYVLGRDAAPGLRPVSPPAGANFVNLSLNTPAVGPHDAALRAALAAIAADAGEDLIAYGPSQGLQRHREAGAAWLAGHGAAVSPHDIVVCSGAQHGTFGALAVLCQPGDTILVEQLTYPGIKAAARLLHLKLVPVARDEQGPDPEALEEACRQHRARAFYVLPTLHNPTAATVPPARREALVEVACRHNLTLIEDDIYAPLHPRPPVPLVALAPDLTFHIGGITKAVAGGLRVSYLACPPEQAERVATTLRATSWMTPPLAAEVATRWIEDGTAARLLQWQRAEIAERHRTAAAALAGQEYLRDDASPHIWLQLPEPWHATDFVNAALRRGVGVSEGAIFSATRLGPPRAIRIGIAAPRRRTDLEGALQVLARLCRDRPHDGFETV